MGILRTWVAVFVVVVACVVGVEAQGTYTQIDYPEAIATTAYGINSSGQVVGEWIDGGNAIHGFLFSDGVFTNIDVPGATETSASGINDNGQVVGGTNSTAFLYDIASQTYSLISYSATTRTIATTINNSGTIAGTIQQTTGAAIAFELNGTDYTLFRPPGNDYAVVTALTNGGQALVTAQAPSTKITFYVAEDGRARQLQVPDCYTPFGLNDSSQIVGYYPPRTGYVQSFLLTNGDRQQISFPRSRSTFANAINDLGQVVGSFSDRTFKSHAFLWTPPAPKGH